MINKVDDIIGIDYGAKRIGVARISPIARIGEPLGVIDAAADNVLELIQSKIEYHQAQACVVGLPRGLNGQETDQTKQCTEFAKLLKAHLGIPVYMIDEAGSTKSAELRIADTGSKLSVDAMAAAIFIEDFVNQQDKEILLI